MVNPLLLVVAVIVMALPAVMAVRTERLVRRFQEQAFGHFRKAARNLRIMVWVVFGYYVFVLLGSLAIGDLRYTVVLPMELEGIQIYVRIGAAILAFWGAHSVARELYQVVEPGRPLEIK